MNVNIQETEKIFVCLKHIEFIISEFGRVLSLPI